MFDFDSLMTTIPIMGKGVLGIFIVIIVVVYAVFLLEFLFPPKEIKDYRAKKKILRKIKNTDNKNI